MFAQYSEQGYHPVLYMYVLDIRSRVQIVSPIVYGWRQRIPRYTRSAIVLISELYPSKEGVLKYLLYMCYAPSKDPRTTKKSNQIGNILWTFIGMSGAKTKFLEYIQPSKCLFMI